MFLILLQVALSSATVEVEHKPYSSVLAPSTVESNIFVHMSTAENAGIEIARKLLQEGAGPILDRARLENHAPANLPPVKQTAPK